MHDIMYSPYIVPVVAILAGIIFAGLNVWKKNREQELTHDREMREKEMAHQMKMKEMDQESGRKNV